MKQYEAMFLFDPTFGAEFEKCEAEIRRLMERANAEIVLCRKWDERRLAYRIEGRKRAVYVLCYFKAPPESIGPLERDARLSEPILRALIIKADELSEEAMEQAFHRPVEEPAAEPSPAGEPTKRTGRRRRRAGPKEEESPGAREPSGAGAAPTTDEPPDTGDQPETAGAAAGESSTYDAPDKSNK